MTEFVNNIQSNAENGIRSSAENSSSCKVDQVRNENSCIAVAMEIDLKVNLSANAFKISLE